jgi:hypothetical protein
MNNWCVVTPDPYIEIHEDGLPKELVRRVWCKAIDTESFVQYPMDGDAIVNVCAWGLGQDLYDELIKTSNVVNPDGLKIQFPICMG